MLVDILLGAGSETVAPPITDAAALLDPEGRRVTVIGADLPERLDCLTFAARETKLGRFAISTSAGPTRRVLANPAASVQDPFDLRRGRSS